MDSKLLVSAEEAAAILSLGRRKIFELLAAGTLESLTVGRRRLIPRQALTEFVERQRQAQREGERA